MSVYLHKPAGESFPPPSPIRDNDLWMYVCVWCNLLAVAEESVLLLADLDGGTAVLLKSALASFRPIFLLLSYKSLCMGGVLLGVTDK